MDRFHGRLIVFAGPWLAAGQPVAYSRGLFSYHHPRFVLDFQTTLQYHRAPQVAFAGSNTSRRDESSCLLASVYLAVEQAGRVADMDLG